MASPDVSQADDRPRRNWRIAVAGLAGTIVVGYLDYLTGPFVGLTLFYILPVAAVSWRAGRRAGIALAVLAASTWLLAEIGWEHEYPFWVSVWNGVTRLTIFVGTSLFLSRIQIDQLQLRRLLDLERSLARTDPLTGLANLRSFIEHTQTRRREDDRRPFCVLYLDMDNFKALNDNYGHLAGDGFLREVGGFIHQAIRASDEATRIGGDEFAIVLHDVEDGAAAAIGERLIERIRVLAERFPLANVAASVGMAHFDHYPEDAAEILRRADEAMYRAKSAGKGRVTEWSASEAQTRRPQT
jgi:diguanylate cyclase (GGDEF)-like protein